MIDFDACPKRLPGVPTGTLSIVRGCVPRQEPIGMLRTALRDAESGELRSVAIVCVYTNHRTAKGHSPECYGDAVLLLGKQRELEFEIVDWMKSR